MLKPFIPSERTAAGNARAISISRAVVGIGRHQELRAAAAFVNAQWGDAHAAKIIEKTAVVPADRSNLTVLSSIAISTLVDILGPDKAFSQLVPRAIPVTFDSYNAITVSGIATDASKVSFQAEGAPIKVVEHNLSAGATLTAGYKLALISVLTREVIESTTADAIVRAKLAEDLSLGLETLLLDDVASSTTRPAGLRNGVEKTVATAGGGLAALTTDLATLAGKVAAVGGGDVVFVADATTVTKIKILAPLFPYPVWPSGGVADGTVVALAPRALCISGSSDAPRISVSREAVLMMDDTTPLPLTTATAASFPIRSLYQTDAVAIRVICADVAWGWRGAGCAWTDTITW